MSLTPIVGLLERRIGLDPASLGPTAFPAAMSLGLSPIITIGRPVRSIAAIASRNSPGFGFRHPHPSSGRWVQ